MVAAAPDYMRSIAVAEQSQQERVATLLLDADRSKQRARYQKLPGNSSPEGMFSTFNSQMAEGSIRRDRLQHTTEVELASYLGAERCAAR
jgi:hypothetical protein